MARFKLTIEYDGSNFKGWQLQKNIRTVHGDLLEIFTKVLQTSTFELYGAGRTDTGVHALGQVAHLDVNTNLQPDKLMLRLNEQIPTDINIINIEPMHPKFHARFDAVARSYVYQISRRRTAFGKPYVWWVKENIDINLMKQCGDLLTGFKDFHSFGDKHADDKSTMVDVIKVEALEKDNSIVIRIIGSHFLWHQVRRMIGVMVQVGKNKMTLEQVHSFFEAFTEEPSRLTAPPTGLYLEKVYYKNEKFAAEPLRLLNIY